MVNTKAVHLRSAAMASILLIFAFARGTAALQLFNATPSGLPSSCASALTTNITCSQFVPAPFVSNQQYLDNSTLSSLCTSTCTESLLSYQSEVDSACGTTAYIFPGNISQTVQQFISPLVWAYNVSCLTSGGAYCYPQVTNPNGTTIQPCSNCLLEYEAAMLGSSYGQVRFDPGSFSSLLSSCGVPASIYPYTTPTSTASASGTSTASASNATCTGTEYVVQSGDTCESIATAHSIATDRFIMENYLDYNCTALTVGNEVCLGASCALYQIKANDTCDSILANQTFYLIQLVSWNPLVLR